MQVKQVSHGNVRHRQRLRKRLFRAGLDAFNDHEIIEYFLTFSIPRGDVKPAAKEVIKRFGSVAGFLDADPDNLKKIKGIGEVSVAAVLFVRSLISYYLKERGRNEPWFPSTQATVTFLQASLNGLKQEVFKVLFLNNRNRLITERTLQTGTVDRSAVYPREIIRAALSEGATRIICAHNHPSGGIEPSEADCRITRDIISAAAPLDIELLEHIIIGTEGFFSFAQSGHISEYYRAYSVDTGKRSHA